MVKVQDEESAEENGASLSLSFKRFQSFLFI